MRILQLAALMAAILLQPGLLLAKDNTAGSKPAAKTAKDATGAASAIKPSNDLAESLENYKNATINNDVEGVLSFVYSSIFKLIPKAQLKTMLMQMYASGKAPTIKAINFQAISAIQSFGIGQFSTVKYAMEMELPRPGDATPDMDQTIIKVLKREFGPATKIIVNEKRNVINIKKNSELLAINEQNSGWKIVEKEKFEMMKNSNILPKELLAKLQ